MLWAFQWTTQYQLQALLDQRGQGGFASSGFLAGAFEQGFIQADGGSHMSEHALGMSVCQDGFRG